MIRPFGGRHPHISDSAFVHPSAEVIGEVAIGERSSVWCNATVRGDVNRIEIGEETNIQDNCCLHVGGDKPLRLGDRVVVGHSVTLHACVVEDDAQIGMGATVLSGARVGKGTIVAAGSLVVEGAEIPPNCVVMGVPAKVRRATRDEEREDVRRRTQNYVELSRTHRESL